MLKSPGLIGLNDWLFKSGFLLYYSVKNLDKISKRYSKNIPLKLLMIQATVEYS